jgi:hypothetical protein
VRGNNHGTGDTQDAKFYVLYACVLSSFASPSTLLLTSGAFMIQGRRCRDRDLVVDIASRYDT